MQGITEACEFLPPIALKYLTIDNEFDWLIFAFDHYNQLD